MHIYLCISTFNFEYDWYRRLLRELLLKDLAMGGENIRYACVQCRAVHMWRRALFTPPGANGELCFLQHVKTCFVIFQYDRCCGSICKSSRVLLYCVYLRAMLTILYGSFVHETMTFRNAHPESRMTIVGPPRTQDSW